MPLVLLRLLKSKRKLIRSSFERQFGPRLESSASQIDRFAIRPQRQRSVGKDFSTLPRDTTLADLVDQAKLRWRIERDYQELKQEVGLGHYEGRGWRGFHHHATLCIAAYGFLIAEQATIPPSGPRSAAPVEVPPLPDNYRPRGSARAA